MSGSVENAITDTVQIPLECIRPTLYVARIEDDRLLAKAKFYLAIKAQMPESWLIEGVPRITKIASLDIIEAVIGYALPGVILKHTSPPIEIPSCVDFYYFMLDTVGPYWEKVKDIKTLATG